MRIVAGRFRGRKVVAPPGRATRPTSDRARQGMFDWLRPYLAGARVLDLYSGSGALGLEALSRGAERVVFVEHHSAALSALRQNVHRLGVDAEARTLNLRVERALVPVVETAPYDLVLCDPPWAQLDAALRALAEFVRQPGLLADDAVVVLEHPAGSEPELDPLSALDRRHWGGIAASLFG